MTRHLISTGSPWEREAAFSRVVVDGEWAFVSGTTGFDYATMTISDDVAEQTRQTLENISSALAQAGFSLADVVQTLYVLPRAEDYPLCWPVLRECFGEIRPANTMLVAGLADPRMRIEIEVTARHTTRGDVASSVQRLEAKRLAPGERSNDTKVPFVQCGDIDRPELLCQRDQRCIGEPESVVRVLFCDRHGTADRARPPLDKVGARLEVDAPLAQHAQRRTGCFSPLGPVLRQRPRRRAWTPAGPAPRTPSAARPKLLTTSRTREFLATRPAPGGERGFTRL